MKRFAIGLGLAILGALLWIMASVIGGVGKGIGSSVPPVISFFMYLGFAVMILAPLTFWVILPIVSRSRRHSV